MSGEKQVKVEGVLRALCTSPGDDALAAFHVAVSFFANGIEQRDQTVFYTVMAEDVGMFLDVARVHDITVEKIHGAGISATVIVGEDGTALVEEEDGPGETYEVLHLGSHGRRWR